MTDHSPEQLKDRYTALVKGRLEARRLQAISLFREVLAAGPQPDLDGLHIEIFGDLQPFGFTVFSVGASDPWAAEPESILQLNAGLEALWPLFTDDGFIELLVWEADTDSGRRAAMEQPIDEVDVDAIAKAWFIDVVTAAAREGSTMPVSISVHDIDPAPQPI